MLLTVNLNCISSVSYTHLSPADVYLAFAVLRADKQAVYDGHRDVELLEDLGLLLYLTPVSYTHLKHVRLREPVFFIFRLPDCPVAVPARFGERKYRSHRRG